MKTISCQVSVLCLALVAAACTSGRQSADGEGGRVSAGGTTGSIGVSSAGGAPASGGAADAGEEDDAGEGGSPGATSEAGAPSAAGTTGTGGTSVTGGTTGAGGSPSSCVHEAAGTGDTFCAASCMSAASVTNNGEPVDILVRPVSKCPEGAVLRCSMFGTNEELWLYGSSTDNFWRVLCAPDSVKEVGAGPCTASKDAGRSVSGSGPHKVVVETNSDPGINCGTIYRPSDLGGAEKYPILVWGNGGCARNGLSNQASMGEIASWGYFVVADGPPGGGGNCGTISTSSPLDVKAKPLLDYITWAIAENGKSCSAYYQSLDTTKVAADGFSCGGLMAEGTAGDPRMTAWGITSSGLTGANEAFYKMIHTPVKVLVGGSGDAAYENGQRDYQNISALGIPIVFFSKDNGGHGGDLNDGKGDFNTINLAWLNWQLKGDTGPTGKGLLHGSSCKYCTAIGWEYQSANIE